MPPPLRTKRSGPTRRRIQTHRSARRPTLKARAGTALAVHRCQSAREGRPSPIREHGEDQDAVGEGKSGLSSLGISVGADKGFEKLDLASESARITALQAKAETLKKQMDKIRTNGLALEDVDAALSQLQRKRQLEDTQYRYFAASLEQARIDETLGAGKLSNISEVQAPSPASFAPSKRLRFMALALCAGAAFGIALAFFLDLYLDQSVKRAIDIEQRLRLPVFLSIPYSNGRPRLKDLGLRPKRLGNGPDGGPEGAAGNSNAQIAPWDANHRLH